MNIIKYYPPNGGGKRNLLFVIIIFMLIPQACNNLLNVLEIHKTEHKDFIENSVIADPYKEDIAIQTFYEDFVDIHGEKAWKVIVEESKTINANPFSVLFIFAFENNYRKNKFYPDRYGKYIGLNQMSAASIKIARDARNLGHITKTEWLNLPIEERLMDIFSYWRESKLVTERISQGLPVRGDMLYLTTAAHSRTLLIGKVYGKSVAEQNPKWDYNHDGTVTAWEIRISPFLDAKKLFKNGNTPVLDNMLNYLKDKQYNNKLLL